MTIQLSPIDSEREIKDAGFIIQNLDHGRRMTEDQAIAEATLKNPHF
jgi:hypothetical protein